VKLRIPSYRLRLIPAVMLLGVALLGIKATGLVMDAQAQDHPSPAPAAPPPQAAPMADPAADDPESSGAQVDVLTSLAKRRTQLDGRERDLDMRENLLAATEKRVDSKIDSLKQLQTQIQALLAQRDAADQKQLDSIVKTYSAMRPKDAARIFNSLNEDVLLAVAGQMKPDVLGAILAGMEPEAAQKLTVKLATRLKLPDVQAQLPAAPAQLASALPPAGAAVPAAAAPAAEAAPAPASPAPSGKTPAPQATGK
jgi:flagellar motility protein MotE (MotC chaperone)